jgi:cysteinyl-tRNA synthetase
MKNSFFDVFLISVLLSLIAVGCTGYWQLSTAAATVNTSNLTETVNATNATNSVNIKNLTNTTEGRDIENISETTNTTNATNAANITNVSSSDNETETAPPSIPSQLSPQHAENKKQITSFVYQLQNEKFEELLAENVSLLIVDPENGDGELQFTKEQIKQFKESGKIVLAYISIGEAENWRKYWKKEWDRKPPTWIGEEDPEWEDNFYVQYWNPEWKSIVFQRLDQILPIGYDGVYLDMVDAYDYWEEKGYKNTKDEMIKFVGEIRNKVKTINPDALIFPQNAVELLDSREYLALIDGIGVEDTFYKDNKVPEWSEWDLSYLEKAIAANKTVLAVDYSTDPAIQCDFIKKSKEHGFIPYVSVRELDRIMHVNCE